MKLNRKLHQILFASGMLFLSVSAQATETNTQCSNKQFTLQLLGSGGPISDDARASSGELIWWKGKPRILIDAGGGVYLRFGQAGAQLEDVDLIAISHLHTDHVADLAALLKGSLFFRQKRETQITGPAGSNAFPGMTDYMYDLFKPHGGAYSYMTGLYEGSDGMKMQVHLSDVDYHLAQPTKIFDKAGLKVTALGIPHGDVPALAFRIETDEGTIVVSADQNGSNKAFLNFANNADILVMPSAINEDADEVSRFMHATPSVIGKIAQATQPKILVLNHFMGASLINKNKNIEIIKKYYSGPVYASRDLSCFPVVTQQKGISNEK
ncbi:MBL fold metallo-hydrolase [Enterobacteriaceae bacterium LUAb1]